MQISAPSPSLPVSDINRMFGQSSGGLTAKPASDSDPAMQAFEDYMNMTPAEKMRAAILGGMGLKEEDLKNMDPKERQKIEDKIKLIIKQQVEAGDKNHKGVFVDVKA
jgi:hypothetical protein